MANPYQKDIQELYVQRPATPACEAMREAFLTLYAKGGTPTIKELCATAHVARTTFYAYYTDLDGLVEELENEMIWELFRISKGLWPIGENGQTLDYVNDVLSYINEKQTWFYTLLVTRPDERLISKWKLLVKYSLWEKKCRCHPNAKNQELSLDMVAAAAISAYTYRLREPQKVDMDNILDLTATLLCILE